MENTIYKYGAMSSRWQLEAPDKFTAYATVVCHYNQSAHMVVVYEPIECKEDSWCSFDGKISERLDEIFGGKDSFDKFVESNIEQIKVCYKSIKRLI